MQKKMYKYPIFKYGTSDPSHTRRVPVVLQSISLKTTVRVATIQTGMQAKTMTISIRLTPEKCFKKENLACFLGGVAYNSRADNSGAHTVCKFKDKTVNKYMSPVKLCKYVVYVSTYVCTLTCSIQNKNMNISQMEAAQ